MYDALDNIIIWNDGVNTWNYTYDAENRLVLTCPPFLVQS